MLEDKEYGTDLTHCRQYRYLLSLKHIMVFAIALHSSTDECQVKSPNLDTPMDTITDLLQVECVCSKHFHVTRLTVPEAQM